MATHWKHLWLLISLLLVAGCSSVNGIVVSVGAAIAADPPAQMSSFYPASIMPTDTATAENVTALLDQAAALANASDFAAALALADEAVALDPANITAHWMRGNYLYELGDLEAARAAYDQSIQSGMNWSRGYLILAGVNKGLGDTAAEMAALTNAIDLSRAKEDESLDMILALAFQRRSELSAQAGNLATAIADLDTALSHNPWNYEQYAVLRNLGHELALRQATFAEDPALLLADLNDRLVANPADLQARLERAQINLQLALIRFDESKLNAAYQDFTQALVIDPSRAEAYHGRALTTWLAHKTFTDLSKSNHQEEATPEAALADLDTALSLAPDLTAARHNRGVIRFTTWFDDAWLSLMFDGPPDTPDENLAAAVADLELAVQQSPDWQLARFNHGMARLFQGITLFGVYMANDGDEETGDAIQRALEDAIADASWLIDQDPAAGWAYFMRFIAVSNLQDLVPDIDPTLIASSESDIRRMLELIPDLNTDDAIFQFADQARLSLQVAPPRLVSSGRLELVSEDLFYANDDYGLRFKLPERIFDSIIATVATDHNLIVHMADSLRSLDVLVIQPQMGERSLDIWLADTLFAATSPGILEEVVPLQTRYGPAKHYQYIDDTDGEIAILVIGDYVYSFEYIQQTDGYGDSSPNIALMELFDSLVVDGTSAD